MNTAQVEVTTVTIMSVTDERGTFAIHSKVTESVESALDHLRAIGDGRGDAVCAFGAAGWRWTWEWVNDLGFRCSDTVRIY